MFKKGNKKIKMAFVFLLIMFVSVNILRGNAISSQYYDFISATDINYFSKGYSYGSAYAPTPYLSSGRLALRIDSMDVLPAYSFSNFHNPSIVTVESEKYIEGTSSALQTHIFTTLYDTSGRHIATLAHTPINPNYPYSVGYGAENLINYNSAGAVIHNILDNTYTRISSVGYYNQNYIDSFTFDGTLGTLKSKVGAYSGTVTSNNYKGLKIGRVETSYYKWNGTSEGRYVYTNYYKVDETIPDTTPPSTSTFIDEETRYSNLADGQTFRAHTLPITDDNSGLEGLYFYSIREGIEADWAGAGKGTNWDTDNKFYKDITVRGEGSYLLRAHPLDNAGNWNWASDEERVIIDRTKPYSSLMQSNVTSTSGNTVKFYITGVGDGLSGVNYVDIYYGLPSTGSSVAGSTRMVTEGNGVWSYTLTTTEKGTVWADAHIYDKAGNEMYVPRKSVNFDNVAPIYSSYEIKNSDENGYEVYIYGVSDNLSGINRVQFPTWTATNGQDDIIWHNGINLGGGTWMYKVNKSEHNNSYDQYFTHVYIYDNAENHTSIAVNAPYIKNIGKIKINESNSLINMGNMVLTDTLGLNLPDKLLKANKLVLLAETSINVQTFNKAKFYVNDLSQSNEKAELENRLNNIQIIN